MALVALVFAVSGCGGSSSSDQTAKFKKSYTTTVVQLKQTSSAIGHAIQGASSETDAQLVTTFRGLAGRWQNQLSQLETLKAPSKVAADFNTLTAAATRVESDLNAIVAAGATHSASAGKQAGASIVPDVLAAKSAATTIDQKLGVK
jgi:type IV pilus biogenesis protein CpaD/CtpE